MRKLAGTPAPPSESELEEQIAEIQEADWTLDELRGLELTLQRVAKLRGG